MKIYMDNFKAWNKILESYQEKGSPIGESLYFNFKDSYVYFGSKEGTGRMRFNFEKELTEENISNFFISTSKFLNIATQYDYLNLTDKLVFTNGKDKYKIAVIQDDSKIDCSFITNTKFEKNLPLNKEAIEKIVKALLFTSKDEANANYRNIFIQQKTICSLTTKTPMYEAPIEIDEDIYLSLNVAKTIIQVGFVRDGCSLMTNAGVNKKIVSRDEELEIIVPGSSSVEFPQNKNAKFIENYSYSTFVKLETETLIKVLSVLRSYFNDVLNSKITLTIDDDINIKVEDSTNSIERHVPYLEVSEELKGKMYSISGAKVEQALSVLKGKELFIMLPTEDTSPIVNFYNDNTQHLLISRFKNE